MTLISLKSSAEPPQAAPNLSPPSPGQIEAEAPDETWCVTDDRGRALGCVSLWWRRPVVHEGRRTGVFGHFRSAGAGVSGRLLKQALHRLRAEGCELATGPIDGSTWYGYRLATEGEGPAFPLDLDTPPEYCDHFRAAGLRELETYCSVSLGPPADLDIEFDTHAGDVAAQGISVRTIDMSAPERDLAAIWALSMGCFAGNPFFAPIAEADFLALYRPFLTLMDPDYVLIAEDGEGLCGFHFAFPWQRPDGRLVVVSKSSAVHPRLRGTGLGSHLQRRILDRAASEGAADFIMAFMHDENLSARWARAHGRVIRRYAVFGKDLS